MNNKMEAPKECTCCCDEITYENSCLYSTNSAPNIWRESRYCIECVRYLLSQRFYEYIKAIQESDCAKELNGLIMTGPPIWLTDKGLPVEEGEHVILIRGTGEPESAMYTGALIGEERLQLWDMLITVIRPCIEAHLTI